MLELARRGAGSVHVDYVKKVTIRETSAGEAGHPGKVIDIRLPTLPDARLREKFRTFLNINGFQLGPPQLKEVKS